MSLKLTNFVRILLGCLLILFGLNGYFSFIPVPEKQGFALEFLELLHQTGYILPIVAIIMMSVGICLLFNRWVAAGLLLLLPVSFNIFAFHLFHDWQGLLIGHAIFAMNCFLIMRRYKQYVNLFN